MHAPGVPHGHEIRVGDHSNCFALMKCTRRAASAKLPQMRLLCSRVIMRMLGNALTFQHFGMSPKCFRHLWVWLGAEPPRSHSLPVHCIIYCIPYMSHSRCHVIRIWKRQAHLEEHLDESPVAILLGILLTHVMWYLQSSTCEGQIVIEIERVTCGWPLRSPESGNMPYDSDYKSILELCIFGL